MKNNFSIKKATLKDLPVIDKLGDGLVDFHKKISSQNEKFYDQRKKNSSIWKKFATQQIKSKKGLVLIIYDQEKPVAYCISIIKKNIPIFKIEEYGYISDLYVDQSYRGKGLGTQLINESKKFFKKNKMRFMEINMHHHNQNAFKFYNHYGFKEYKKTLRMKL